MNKQEELVQRLAKKTGLRGKLDAKCAECSYDPYQAGSWRKQVEKCTSLSCPLYPIRPKSEGASK